MCCKGGKISNSRKPSNWGNLTFYDLVMVISGELPSKGQSRWDAGRNCYWGEREICSAEHPSRGEGAEPSPSCVPSPKQLPKGEKDLKMGGQISPLHLPCPFTLYIFPIQILTKADPTQLLRSDEIIWGSATYLKPFKRDQDHYPHITDFAFATS